MSLLKGTGEPIWKLSEDGSIKNTDTDCTVDNFGGYEAEKVGNGSSKDILAKFQDNIRERFDLESPDEDTDETDSNY